MRWSVSRHDGKPHEGFGLLSKSQRATFLEYGILIHAQPSLKQHKTALVAAHATDCDPEENDLARQVLKRIGTYTKFGIPIKIATIATMATGSNAAIIPSPDYYDNGIFTDELSLVGAGCNVKIMFASLLATIMWLLLAYAIKYAVGYYKALLKELCNTVLMKVRDTCNYYLDGIQEEEIEIVIFHASTQTEVDMKDKSSETEIVIYNASTQATVDMMDKSSETNQAHIGVGTDFGTQTPASKTPLPIQNLAY